MKSYNLKIRSFPLPLIGILAMFTISTIMNSCKKATVTYEKFDASNLRVVNGFSERTNVKFYLDSLNFTLSGTLEYNVVSPYYVTKSGLREAQFYSTDTKDTFARDKIQLDPNKDYTLFLAGNLASPKFWLTEDDLTTPPADKAKIRFANLAFTGVNVDVTVQSQDTSLPQPKPEVMALSNISPESISDYTFVTVPETIGNWKDQRHTIRIYETGTNNLVTSLAGVDLRGTSIETIILTGGGIAPAFTLSSSKEWLDW